MSRIKDEAIYRRTLSSGIIEIRQQSGHATFDDLFDIAERKNPKRAFLFVSKVLGRHIPVPPSVMRRASRQLAEQFPTTLPQPLLCIGMAETAVGLGAGVFDTLRHRYPESVYLTSTRHPVRGELLCEFQEQHSHATDHLIYLPSDPVMRRQVTGARTLVLIDDEATTGNTFCNLLGALQATGKLTEIEQVEIVTLTDWSGDALAARCSLPVMSFSLMSGQWRWTPLPDAPLPEMPAVNITADGAWPICGKQSWGRLGMNAPAADFAAEVTALLHERILVLGSGEFVWEPFLLAERLEAQGAEVLFSSTTRSPIATGYAIKSALCFRDNYGLGIANFAYNIAHQRFDRILLCVETPADSVDRQLLNALSALAPRVEVLSYD